jgi:hypothetical protein
MIEGLLFAALGAIVLGVIIVCATWPEKTSDEEFADAMRQARKDCDEIAARDRRIKRNRMRKHAA